MIVENVQAKKVAQTTISVGFDRRGYSERKTRLRRKPFGCKDFHRKRGQAPQSGLEPETVRLVAGKLVRGCG